MTSSSPDFSDWTLGLRKSGNGEHCPIDMRPLIWPETSSLDPRVFRRTDTKKYGVPDSDRLGVISAMIDEIKRWDLSLISAGSLAQAFKRFVRWVDISGSPLSRDTVVGLLAQYDVVHIRQVMPLRRAATALNLSDAERKQLFPPPSESGAVEDDWCFRLSKGSYKYRSADFARLLLPGDAALSSSKFRSLRQTRLAQNHDSPRASLVIAIRDEFRAIRTARSRTDSGLATTWRNLRHWFCWADEQRLDLSAKNAVVALQRFSQGLSMRWRSGSLSAKTAHTMVDTILPIVAAALKLNHYEIQLVLNLPPLKFSGLQTPPLNTASLKVICANLHALIEALPTNVITTPQHASRSVWLWSQDGICSEYQLPAPYGGYDASIDTLVANLALTRLRIWAELRRFIAVTGCNLSVATSITIGQHLAADPVWKGRAHRHIAPRIAKLYARHLRRHVAFLSACVPGGVNDDTPLFPQIDAGTYLEGDLVARARAGSIVWNVHHQAGSNDTSSDSWVSKKGVPTCTNRQLRRVKAEWLLRRYGGDSLLVSNHLGNTPQVTMISYGGKGNLHRAALEWSRHWVSSELQSALAPGKCNVPGRYEPITEDFTGSTCIAGACFGCVHYRGEDSLDYVHQLLTYKSVLQLRVAANSEMERPIILIDSIVQNYINMHPDQKSLVEKTRKHINMCPHPRYAALLKLGGIMC